MLNGFFRQKIIKPDVIVAALTIAVTVAYFEYRYQRNLQPKPEIEKHPPRPPSSFR